jgi:hypothetical protein
MHQVPVGFGVQQVWAVVQTPPPGQAAAQAII